MGLSGHESHRLIRGLESCRTELSRALERTEITEVTVIPGLLPERKAL